MRGLGSRSLQHQCHPTVNPVAFSFDPVEIEGDVTVIEIDIGVGREPPVDARRADIEYTAILNRKPWIREVTPVFAEIVFLCTYPSREYTGAPKRPSNICLCL